MLLYCAGTLTQMYKAQDNLEELIAFMHEHIVKRDLKGKK